MYSYIYRYIELYTYTKRIGYINLPALPPASDIFLFKWENARRCARPSVRLSPGSFDIACIEQRPFVQYNDVKQPIRTDGCCPHQNPWDYRDWVGVSMWDPWTWKKLINGGNVQIMLRLCHLTADWFHFSICANLTESLVVTSRLCVFHPAERTSRFVQAAIEIKQCKQLMNNASGHYTATACVSVTIL